jgi:NADH dehydrogenase [ubiquinone] 1 alpha subcomplex assembly factor 7
VNAFGTVTQKDFLHEMGIETRLNVLMKNATEKQKQDLQSSYKRLTDPTDMGHVFKVLSFAHEKIGIPAGFYQNKP